MGHACPADQEATAGDIVDTTGTDRWLPWRKWTYRALTSLIPLGVAGFVRPVVMPMAQAAVESDGKKIAPEQLENIKGMAAGMENITWFFGQMLFVGGAGALLVQNTLEPLGYHVELIGLASVAVAPAIIATIAAIVYYQVLDRKDTKRYHSEQLSMDGDK